MLSTLNKVIIIIIIIIIISTVQSLYDVNMRLKNVTVGLDVFQVIKVKIKQSLPFSIVHLPLGTCLVRVWSQLIIRESGKPWVSTTVVTRDRFRSSKSLHYTCSFGD